MATRTETLGILTRLARDGRTTAAIALAKEPRGDEPASELEEFLVASEELKASRYLRRRRPRVAPFAWARFRVRGVLLWKRLFASLSRGRFRVRGVLPWKRLLASLNRSRNLSPAVFSARRRCVGRLGLRRRDRLRPLAIFDSFRRDSNWGQHRDTDPQRGRPGSLCDFAERFLTDEQGRPLVIESFQRQVLADYFDGARDPVRH